MAREKTKPARKKRAGKTLVRGADGALYMLTKTDAPVKLKEDEAEEVEDILDDAEKKLGEIIDKAIPRFDFACTRSVHVTIPEVFME